MSYQNLLYFNKKILFAGILFLFTALKVSAANFYFIGSDGGNWSDTSNWSNTANGAAIGILPSDTDTVYISKKINLNNNFTVLDVHFTSFNGSGIQLTDTFSLNVLGDIYMQNTNTGSHANSTATLIISGTGDQFIHGYTSSTTQGYLPKVEINKPSGTLYLKDLIPLRNDFSLINGNVDASTYNSTLYLRYSLTLSGNIDLYSLAFGLNSYSTSYTIAAASTINVLHDLRYTSSGSINVNGPGELHAKGDIYLNNTHAYTGNNSSVVLTIDGTADQFIYGHTNMGDNNEGFLPKVVINKPSGTLYLKNLIPLMNDLSLINGNVDASTHLSSVIFRDGVNLSGNLNFYDLLVATSLNIDSGSVINVLHDLRYTSSSAITINGPGELHAKGDIYLQNTHVNTGRYSSVILTINGTGDQFIYGHTNMGDNNEGFLPKVAINKPSGTLYLKNLIPLRKDFSLINGNVDASTHLSSVILRDDVNLSGNINFYDLLVATSLNIDSGSVINVLHDLRYTSSSAITINGPGELHAKGDIYLTNTHVNTGRYSSVILTINGTADQFIYGHTNMGDNNEGFLPKVAINKPSGTLYLKNLIPLRKDFSLINGNVDASTHLSSVILRDDVNLSGNINFYDLLVATSLNIDSGSVINVLHDLRYTSSSAITINGPGELHAKGDIYLQNTHVNTGRYSSVILTINGTGDQFIYGHTTNASYSKLPYVKVNKPTGKLCLKDNINVAKDWEHVTGIVDTCCYEVVKINILGNNGLVAECDYEDCQAVAAISFSEDTVRLLDSFLITVKYGGNDAVIRFYDYSSNTLLHEGVMLESDTFSLNEVIDQTTIFPNDGDFSLPVGDYILEIEVYDSLSNCSKTVRDTLIVLDVYHPFSVSANILYVGTEDSTGIIDLLPPSGGTAPYSYLWDNGSTNSSINNLTGGIYSVKITDSLGVIDSFSFKVDYQAVMESSEAFIKNDNGDIAKHSEAVYDDELMTALVNFNVNSDDYIKVKFSTINTNDKFNFSIGFDLDNENISSTLLQFEIKCINDTLFSYQNGGRLSNLGFYNQNDEITASFHENLIEISKNKIALFSFESQEGQVKFYPKVGFSSSTLLEKLIFSIRAVPKGFTENYATLTKKLDAGYYTMLNDIKYKYQEKYNDNNANYVVYDWKRTPKMSGSIQPQGGHHYGQGYYQIKNAYNYLNDNEFYTFEIINEKNEVYKMRFKFEKIVSDFTPPGNGEVTIGWGTLSCCNQGIKRCCYANPLIPVVLFNNPILTGPLTTHELFNSTKRN